MTDKELLELAAMAAGILGYRYCDSKGMAKWEESDGGWFSGDCWNPLTDDGDALRLSVKLKIDIKQYDDHVTAWYAGGYLGTGRIFYGGDPCAATRRAIVRAAAAVGKAMQ